MDCTTLIQEQIQLLAEWNKKNIEKEPEQVCKNIEAIACIMNATPKQMGRPK